MTERMREVDLKNVWNGYLATLVGDVFLYSIPASASTLMPSAFSGASQKDRCCIFNREHGDRRKHEVELGGISWILYEI